MASSVMLTDCEKGIVGSIDPMRFKWTPPWDPTHIDMESNATALYDVPPPEDIPEYDRKQIDNLLIARGKKPLPSFITFLKDCRLTFLRYFPRTASRYYAPVKHFHNDEEFLKAVEEERILRWGEIKRWSPQDIQTAMDKLWSMNKKKVAKGRKRGSSDSSSISGHPAASLEKRSRVQRGVNDDEVVRAPSMQFPPSTPRQHGRRASQLSQQWSPSMPRYHEEETLSFPPSTPYQRRRGASQLSHEWSPSMPHCDEAETRNTGRSEQYLDRNSSLVTPSHNLNGTDIHQSLGYITSPHSSSPFGAQGPHMLDRTGNWNNPLPMAYNDQRDTTTQMQANRALSLPQEGSYQNHGVDFFSQGGQFIHHDNSQTSIGPRQHGGSNSFMASNQMPGNAPSLQESALPNEGMKPDDDTLFRLYNFR